MSCGLFGLQETAPEENLIKIFLVSSCTCKFESRFVLNGDCNISLAGSWMNFYFFYENCSIKKRRIRSWILLVFFFFVFVLLLPAVLLNTKSANFRYSGMVSWFQLG